MLLRLWKYATKNILRNTFLSVSSVLILTLLMFFINILIIVYDVSFRIIDSINDRLTISLYLDEAYDKNTSDVINLQEEIESTLPEVSYSYKTKEELLDDLRERDPDLVNILEKQNPLPETITLENIPLQKYDLLDTIIQSRLYILTESWQEANIDEDYFSSYKQQFERIGNVISTLKVLQIGLYIVIITFLVSIAIIVYSIIGNFIYYYKDEIYITRLVGGSKIFIYGPFSLQGMMYVGIAFIFSSLLFFLFLSNVSYLLELWDIDGVYSGNLLQVLAFEALVFLIIGALSWFFSSLRYLKK